MDLFDTTATAVAAIQQAFALIQLEDEAFAMSMTCIIADEPKKRKWGGSKPGKAPNKKCDFNAAHDLIEQHYFKGSDSVYDEQGFQEALRRPSSRLQRCLEGAEW